MRKLSKMLLVAAVPCIVATSFCLFSVTDIYADESMSERERYASVRIVKVDYMNSLDNLIVEQQSPLDLVTDSAVQSTRLVTEISEGRQASPVIDDDFYNQVEEEALQDEKLAKKLELSLAEQKLSEMEEQLRDSEKARSKLEEKIKEAEAKKLKAQQEAEEAKKAAKEAEKEAKEATIAAEKAKAVSNKSSLDETSSYSKDLKVTYSEDDKSILRKIIAAEAGDQGYTGMQYVGEVIRNRCVRYKKSVEEVVFSPHQFSPVSNGTYETAYGKLSKDEKEDIEKVIEALEDGINEAQNAIYFKMYGYHSDCKPLFKYKDHYFSKNY